MGAADTINDPKVGGSRLTRRGHYQSIANTVAQAMVAQATGAATKATAAAAAAAPTAVNRAATARTKAVTTKTSNRGASSGRRHLR